MLLEFCKQEDGWISVTGAFWALIFIIIAGLAIDPSNAFQAKTRLAAATDAAALAAVVDLPDVDKARATGNDQIMVCERGVSFGYNNLVSDMRSLAAMRDTGAPVVFDATHSVQLPGGQGSASGGQREYVPVLARAAVAAGIAGVFMETHPEPARALSDGPNAWPLRQMQDLLEILKTLDDTVKSRPFAEAALLGG